MTGKVSRTEVRWLLKDKYGGKETPEFFADLKRLEKGEPVDYLIGWVPFLGVKVDLSYRPLVPRIETEEWAQKAIDDMKRSGIRKLRVLDIFAGAGNIGSAVLKHVPGSHVVFAEKSRAALKGIAKTCRESGFHSSSYEIVESDVFSALSGRFHYILANPPYVAIEDAHLVDESVKTWEPHMAVFGGRKGDLFIRRFLLEAPGFLEPGGKLYMEFDYFQKKNVEVMLGEAGYSSYSCKRDQAGRWRYCVAVL